MQACLVQFARTCPSRSERSFEPVGERPLLLRPDTRFDLLADPVGSLPLLLSKSYPSLLHGVINLFCRKNDEKLIEFAKLNEAVRIFSFRTEKVREEEYFYSSKKAEITIRENS